VAGSGRTGGGILSLLASFFSDERDTGSERDTTIDLGRGRGTGRVVDAVTFSGEPERFGFVADPILAAASARLGSYRTAKFRSVFVGCVLGLLSGRICTRPADGLPGLNGDESSLEDLLLSRGEGLGRSAVFGSCRNPVSDIGFASTTVMTGLGLLQ